MSLYVPGSGSVDFCFALCSSVFSMSDSLRKRRVDVRARVSDYFSMRSNETYIVWVVNCSWSLLPSDLAFQRFCYSLFLGAMEAQTLPRQVKVVVWLVVERRGRCVALLGLEKLLHFGFAVVHIVLLKLGFVHIERAGGICVFVKVGGWDMRFCP